MRLPKAFMQNEITMTELQILQGVTKIFKMFLKIPGDSNLKNKHLGGKFYQRYLHTSGGS